MLDTRVRAAAAGGREVVGAGAAGVGDMPAQARVTRGGTRPRHPEMAPFGHLLDDDIIELGLSGEVHVDHPADESLARAEMTLDDLRLAACSYADDDQGKNCLRLSARINPEQLQRLSQCGVRGDRDPDAAIQESRGEESVLAFRSIDALDEARFQGLRVLGEGLSEGQQAYPRRQARSLAWAQGDAAEMHEATGITQRERGELIAGAAIVGERSVVARWQGTGREVTFPAGPARVEKRDAATCVEPAKRVAAPASELRQAMASENGGEGRFGGAKSDVDRSRHRRPLRDACEDACEVSGRSPSPARMVA